MITELSVGWQPFDYLLVGAVFVALGGILAVWWAGGRLDE